MYNKIGKNLINEVFSIHGKKDGDVNISVLEGLKKQIKSTIPEITNNRIRYDLKKARDYLSRKIKRTSKLKKYGLSNNSFYNKLRQIIKIQKTKTNNIEKLENLLKQRNKIINELKKEYKYIDNNYIKNLLKNIEKLENNNGPILILSSIRKDVLNKSGKSENIDILIKKRENLKKIKNNIPKNKKEEYTSTLRKIRNKIHSTRYIDKKRELYHNKKKQKQINNMNNNTNAIGMLIEQEYMKNNPNINKIPSVSSDTRLRPGRYKLTKNNLTKL